MKPWPAPLGHGDGRQHAARRAPQWLARRVVQVGLHRVVETLCSGVAAVHLPLQQQQAGVAQQERLCAVGRLARVGEVAVQDAGHEGFEVLLPADDTCVGQMLQCPDRAARAAVQKVHRVVRRVGVVAWVRRPACVGNKVRVRGGRPLFDGGARGRLAPRVSRERLVAFRPVQHRHFGPPRPKSWRAPHRPHVALLLSAPAFICP